MGKWVVGEKSPSCLPFLSLRLAARSQLCAAHLSSSSSNTHPLSTPSSATYTTRFPLLPILLALTYYLLPVLAAARRLPRSFHPRDPNNPNTTPSCKTNAECLRLGLPILPPTRRRHDARQARTSMVIYTPTTISYDDVIQTYNVLATGTYSIRVVGASGGDNTAGFFVDYTGGLGGDTRATFTFTAGTQLSIVTGGTGGSVSTSIGAGGGGGTFVYTIATIATPIIVAGGGGGAASGANGISASITTSGTAGGGSQNAAGGSSGNGGIGGGAAGAGAAGAGFLADGGAGVAQGNGNTPQGGQERTGGFTGGLGSQRTGSSQNAGGFGGAGGGGSLGGGGGGGYSGGGGGRGQSSGVGVGGGGAAFVTSAFGATGSAIARATVAGNGFVVITRLT